jgi:hypothetical protein
MFVLVFLQPLLIAILLPERLIIRLLPDSVPPIIKMLSSWGQVLSLTILTLNVTCIVAINLGSIEGEASQLIGDLQGDFEKFEQAVESELSKALVNSDGVLAQFSMGHQTYATRPIAPTMETSLMVNTEHHLSALNLYPLAFKAMSRSDSTVKAARAPRSRRPLTLQARTTVAGTTAGWVSHWTALKLCSRSTSS